MLHNAREHELWSFLAWERGFGSRSCVRICTHRGSYQVRGRGSPGDVFAAVRPRSLGVLTAAEGCAAVSGIGRFRRRFRNWKVLRLEGLRSSGLREYPEGILGVSREYPGDIPPRGFPQGIAPQGDSPSEKLHFRDFLDSFRQHASGANHVQSS